MALALTRFSAFGVIPDSETRYRALQRVVMDITGANTDVSWDLGNPAGTFWTAAKADATYGAMATQALTVLTNIQGIAKSLNTVQGTVPTTRQNTYSSKQILSFLSNAAVGAGTSEALTVTGLLATDTILSVAQSVPGATSRPVVLSFLSNASSGGAATEVMTVTGVKATDTILSVTQSVAGGNSTALIAYNTLADNALTAVWTANPGAGAKIIVTVARTATQTDFPALIGYNTQADNALTAVWGLAPGAGAKIYVTVSRASAIGSYTQTIQNLTPNFTFLTASAPTSATVTLEWLLGVDQAAVYADFNVQ